MLPTKNNQKQPMYDYKLNSPCEDLIPECQLTDTQCSQNSQSQQAGNQYEKYMVVQQENICTQLKYQSGDSLEFYTYQQIFDQEQTNLLKDQNQAKSNPEDASKWSCDSSKTIGQHNSGVDDKFLKEWTSNQETRLFKMVDKLNFSNQKLLIQPYLDHYCSTPYHNKQFVQGIKLKLQKKMDALLKKQAIERKMINIFWSNPPNSVLLLEEQLRQYSQLPNKSADTQYQTETRILILKHKNSCENPGRLPQNIRDRMNIMRQRYYAHQREQISKIGQIQDRIW